ncbi:MAG: QueT transporter family protein [Bacilli bacterium]
MKRFFSIRYITTNAMIAALYVVMSLISGPLAFAGGSLQLRFSEILNLLVFFNPSYCVGVTLGCLLTNFMSNYGWPDLVIGTLGTLISCLLIILTSKTIKNLFVSSLIPGIINAVVVPFVVYLYDTSMSLATLYFVSFGWVLLGELICVTAVGYPLMLLLTKKYKGFYKVINATQNLEYKW